MRRVFSLVAVMGIVAAMLVAPTAAVAQAEFSEYGGVESAAGPPTDIVVRPAGETLHLTQTSYWHDDTSDDRMTGDTVVYAHAMITDFVGGDAIVWGTFTTYVDAYDATWQGRWSGRMTGGIPVFRVTGHGTGELEGLKVIAEYSGNADGTIAISGRILDPHGN